MRVGAWPGLGTQQAFHVAIVLTLYQERLSEVIVEDEIL